MLLVLINFLTCMETSILKFNEYVAFLLICLSCSKILKVVQKGVFLLSHLKQEIFGLYTPLLYTHNIAKEINHACTSSIKSTAWKFQINSKNPTFNINFTSSKREIKISVIKIIKKYIKKKKRGKKLFFRIQNVNKNPQIHNCVRLISWLYFHDVIVGV